MIAPSALLWTTEGGGGTGRVGAKGAAINLTTIMLFRGDEGSKSKLISTLDPMKA